ncbi:MAG: helix-hairpin-helix domain-containing protein [Oscillospiraceae bacterium]|nr:helix-hairpin-helix domain-containing protein [Oscillospiraceae bacterium]
MKQRDMAKILVAVVCVAVIFVTGLYFGRTGMMGAFTVTTEYAIGAVESQEIEALAERVEHRNGAQAQEEQPATPQEQEVVTPVQEGPININTADANQLTTLPGVGPVLAERIIAHREAHGPFQIVEELTDVSGIGDQRLEDIRPLVTVE